MKKIGIFGMSLLLAGSLAADVWFEQFENGISSWKIAPQASPVELIADKDAAHGKVLKVSAENSTSGINSPFFAIPEGRADEPWILDFDFRCENPVRDTFTVIMQYFAADKKTRVGQITLRYVRPEDGACDWTHCRAYFNVANRKIPAGAVYASLRLGYWNKELDCVGSVIVDNIKLIYPGKIGAQWSSDFESGMDLWKITPKQSPVKWIDDPDTAHGKAMQLSADNGTSGLNSEYLPVPKGTAGKPWTIEFDLRSEGVTQGSAAVVVQYFDATKKKRVGQTTLLYVRPENGTYGWKHYKMVVGTGKKQLPADAAFVSLRFSFWNQELNCIGTIVADNVKITPPQVDAVK